MRLAFFDRYVFGIEKVECLFVDENMQQIWIPKRPDMSKLCNKLILQKSQQTTHSGGRQHDRKKANSINLQKVKQLLVYFVTF